MRPLNSLEVESLADRLSQWLGAQLQEIQVEGGKDRVPRSMRLGFYLPGGVRWLLFDYTVQSPQLLIFDRDVPALGQRLRRPIELFTRSKLLGRRLRIVRTRPEEGRAIDLILDPGADGEEAVIELKLFPHARNVIARFGEGSVAEFKPMPLAQMGEFKSAGDGAAAGVRTPDELVAEWMAPRTPRVSEKKQPAPVSDLAKKQKVLEKVRAELLAKENAPQRQVGEWLKREQTLELPKDWPEDWRDAVDPDESLAENITRLFQEAKSIEKKLDGTKARIRELEKEIATPEKSHVANSPHANIGGKSDLFQIAGARGRKFQVSDDLILYLGKNASENLAILRKAQPFDYWLHLRELPGAHAILRRARGRNVTDEELRRAGVYVAEQSMKRRANEMKGEAFDLLIVECRFVRPIKGDKMGRVNYSNDRVLRLKF